MRTWLDAHKPAASRRTHLLLASCMWSVVGLLLLFFGARWLLAHRWGIALLPAAVLAGALKSRFVLDGTARRIGDACSYRAKPSLVAGSPEPHPWAFFPFGGPKGRRPRADSPPLT